MAGNEKSGRIPIFPLTEKQLEQKFDQYRRDLEAGEFEKPTVPHFCFYIGVTEDELEGFVREYSAKPDSAYYRRARMMKMILQYFRGELFSSRAFSGQGGATIARMLAAHDYGDGITYKEKDSAGQGIKDITVLFGGGDPRAEKASK